MSLRVRSTTIRHLITFPSSAVCTSFTAIGRELIFCNQRLKNLISPKAFGVGFPPSAAHVQTLNHPCPLLHDLPEARAASFAPLRFAPKGRDLSEALQWQRLSRRILTEWP